MYERMYNVYDTYTMYMYVWHIYNIYGPCPHSTTPEIRIWSPEMSPRSALQAPHSVPQRLTSVTAPHSVPQRPTSVTVSRSVPQRPISVTAPQQCIPPLTPSCSLSTT